MIRLSFQASLGLLAIIQAGSTTSLTFEKFSRRPSTLSSRSLHRQQNGTVWPYDITGLVHNESWPNFTEATTRWSTYKAPSFDEVFLPETGEELAQGLKYMSDNNMEWLAKSGGHGYSTTLQVVQDAVLVNMENFNYANVQGDGTVVVGSGMLFGDLVKILGDAGREVNVGACPCVGATGAMLGGGLGRLQGKHGLTSDALRKAEIALWNGTIVEASENINSELFWALRGSGQNYGIVYETTYETWAAENNGMHYNADMTFRKGDIASIMQIINSLTGPGLNRNLAFITFFAQNATTSELAIIVNLVYAGPESEGQKYTKLFSNFSLSLAESVIPWSELPTKSVLGLLPAACAEGPRYDLYSLISRTLVPQTWVDFTNAFETFLTNNPLANGSAMMIETFALQGIEVLPDDYSAFPHRKFFQNHIESIGAYEDDSVAGAVDSFFLEWRTKFIDVDGSDQLQIYQNYGHGDEPLSALYGYDQWRHVRLTKVKNQYDPKGNFDGYHAIPKDLAKWT